MLEHVCFHYLPIGTVHCGATLDGCRMVTVRNAYILPVINTNEIPETESYQSFGCFQEVIDEDNHHVLIYFGITISHIGD